jgi:aspartate/methionine/tyrosine aminotransferase
MAKLDTFAIEEYMNKYEATPGCIDVGTVVAAAISVDELLALNSDKTASHPLNFSTRLTYGDVPGSEALRTNIASLYQTSSASLSPDDVLITQGTAGANFLVYYSLLQPGDHVVCIYPTFQQLISLPKSFGAEVSLWKVEMKDGFMPRIDMLESLVQKNTKV